MPLKHIVLHADASTGFKARACVAGMLTQKTGALLSAVHNRPRGSILRAEFAAPGMLLENYDELMWGYERKSRGILRDQCEPRQVDFEWTREDSDPLQAIQYKSRLADVIVVGQDGTKSNPTNSTVRATDVVLSSGRPCLVVPNDVAPGWTPGNIAIAWNDSDESAKAVRESKSWLEAADSVHVVCVSDDEIATHDLEHYLDKLNVQSVVHRFGVVRAQSEAGAIADWCTSENIDLLVLGAYGHRRSYEVVFGGVTEHMMRRSKIPILIVR